MEGSQINNHVLPSNGISSIDINMSNNFTLYDNIYFAKLQDIRWYIVFKNMRIYSINYDTEEEILAIAIQRMILFSILLTLILIINIQLILIMLII